MTGSTPVIYILHGDDEYAIAQFLDELESRLGDPATAQMNTSHLDGRTYNLDELLTVAGAMPFLARRRLVILIHPTARLSSQAAQDRFLEQLQSIPATTALVLVEYRLLTEDRERRKKKIHWLEKWAVKEKERVYLREFRLPEGQEMANWIQKQSKQAGGQFTPQAAGLLAALAGGETRLADQEIQKLLAYVNYKRPVEAEDVEVLTADVAPGDIFALVDALGNQDGRKAMGVLHRLLEQQEPLSIFSMIVRQFRLLLLAREVLDGGGHSAEVASQLKISPWLADKLAAQARRFSLTGLEAIYHSLLDVDEAVKTGQVPDDLALDSLVAALTTSPVQTLPPR